MPISLKKLSRVTLPGLKFTSGGVLSGIPTKPGAYKLKIQAIDSCIPPQTKEKVFDITD